MKTWRSCTEGQNIGGTGGGGEKTREGCMRRTENVWIPSGVSEGPNYVWWRFYLRAISSVPFWLKPPGVSTTVAFRARVGGAKTCLFLWFDIPLGLWGVGQALNSLFSQTSFGTRSMLGYLKHVDVEAKNWTKTFW